MGTHASNGSAVGALHGTGDIEGHQTHRPHRSEPSIVDASAGALVDRKPCDLALRALYSAGRPVVDGYPSLVARAAVRRGTSATTRRGRCVTVPRPYATQGFHAAG